MAYKAIIKCIAEDESIKESWAYTSQWENPIDSEYGNKVKNFVAKYAGNPEKFMDLEWKDGEVDEDPYCIQYARTNEVRDDLIELLIPGVEHLYEVVEISDEEMDEAISRIQTQHEVNRKPLSD